MSIFDDEEDSNSGMIALLEVKKIKRAMLKLHGSIETMRSAIDKMEKTIAKMEGSLEALMSRGSEITVTTVTGDNSQNIMKNEGEIRR